MALRSKSLFIQQYQLVRWWWIQSTANLSLGVYREITGNFVQIRVGNRVSELTADDRTEFSTVITVRCAFGFGSSLFFDGTGAVVGITGSAGGHIRPASAPEQANAIGPVAAVLISPVGCRTIGATVHCRRQSAWCRGVGGKSLNWRQEQFPRNSTLLPCDRNPSKLFTE